MGQHLTFLKVPGWAVVWVVLATLLFSPPNRVPFNPRICLQGDPVHWWHWALSSTLCNFGRWQEKRVGRPQWQACYFLAHGGQGGISVVFFKVAVRALSQQKPSINVLQFCGFCTVCALESLSLWWCKHHELWQRAPGFRQWGWVGIYCRWSILAAQSFLNLFQGIFFLWAVLLIRLMMSVPCVCARAHTCTCVHTCACISHSNSRLSKRKVPLFSVVFLSCPGARISGLKSWVRAAQHPTWISQRWLAPGWVAWRQEGKPSPWQSLLRQPSLSPQPSTFPWKEHVSIRGWVGGTLGAGETARWCFLWLHVPMCDLNGRPCALISIFYAFRFVKEVQV